MTSHSNDSVMIDTFFTLFAESCYSPQVPYFLEEGVPAMAQQYGIMDHIFRVLMNLEFQ